MSLSLSRARRNKQIIHSLIKSSQCIIPGKSTDPELPSVTVDVSVSNLDPFLFMKQILLALGCGALTVSSLSAAVSLEPVALPNWQVAAISPDGLYIVSDLNGTLITYDRETGEENTYEADYNTGTEYNTGVGNCVSNNRIVVGGTTMDNAAYLVDGEWHLFNVPDAKYTCSANGITPDGSVVCGNVGQAPIGIDEQKVPMVAPCVWYRQADGSFGDPVILPHPNVDFSGRTAQYVTAVTISGDGKTVVGQIVDWTGYMHQTIVYTCGADNEWSYSIPQPQLVNPDNLQFPEWPGDNGPKEPTYEDFMTDAEIEAYNAAMEQWRNDGYDYSNIPNAADFISDEGLAQYNEAHAAWEPLNAEYLAKVEAFNEVFYQVLEASTDFVFNLIKMSPDGKKIALSSSKEVEDPNSWFGYSTKYFPTVIGIGDSSLSTSEFGDGLLVSFVGDDGTVVGCYQGEDFRRAKVLLPGATDYTPLQDYVASRNASLGAWMEENMKHEYTDYVLNEETGEYEEATKTAYFTGFPTVSDDMNTIACATQDLWAFEVDCYSYILPIAVPSASVGTVKAEKLGGIAVKALKGGVITLQGAVSNLTVSDLNGRVLVDVAPKSSTVVTGLASGIYLVKATAADGTSVVTKAAF